MCIILASQSTCTQVLSPIVLDNYDPWSRIPDLSTCSRFVYLYWCTSLLLTFLPPGFPSVFIVTVVTKYDLDSGLWSKKNVFHFSKVLSSFSIVTVVTKTSLDCVCSWITVSSVFKSFLNCDSGHKIQSLTKILDRLRSWIAVAPLVTADTKFSVSCAVAVAQNTIFDWDLGSQSLHL